MDFGKAFTFTFEDKNWAEKFLIPALISIIPIIGQIYILGWSLDITRRVIQHSPTPLPELDFGRQFIEGLKAFVVGLVYALPIIILVVPITVMSAMAGNSRGGSGLGPLVAIVTLCFTALIFLYALFLAFVIPAAYANMAAKDDLAAAFNFKQIVNLIQTAPGAFLIVLVGTLIAGFIAPLGSVLCGIGAVLTYTYAMAIDGHLYGQAYNEAVTSPNLPPSEGFAKIY